MDYLEHLDCLRVNFGRLSTMPTLVLLKHFAIDCRKKLWHFEIGSDEDKSEKIDEGVNYLLVLGGDFALIAKL